jgi:hypothetical protein
MKRAFLAVLFFSQTLVFASDKARPYEDAVLVSFRTATTGSRCQSSSNGVGTLNSNTDEDGHTNGSVASSNASDISCRDIALRYYTISMDGKEFVLRPIPRPFNRPSVLSSSLPGSHLEVSIDKKNVYVRVDGKESKFEVVEAH